MKVAIWNTYAKRKDVDKEMQFDILVPNTMNNMQSIIEFGLEYLQSKPFKTWGINSSKCKDSDNCKSCYSDKVYGSKIIEKIKQYGYAIEELQNCY